MQPSTRAANFSVTPPKEDLVLSDLWLIIRKRRMLVVGITLCLGLMAAISGFRRGKLYTATGEIQIQPGTAAELKQSISGILGGGGSSLDVVIESDSRILTSEKLLLSVARTLKLQDNEAFLGGRSSVTIGLIRQGSDSSHASGASGL